MPGEEDRVLPLTPLSLVLFREAGLAGLLSEAAEEPRSTRTEDITSLVQVLVLVEPGIRVPTGIIDSLVPLQGVEPAEVGLHLGLALVPQFLV